MKMGKIKAVFIGNILETYYQVYEKMPQRQKDYWLKHDWLEANRTLFYDADDKVVATSWPILETHQKEICQLMKWRNVFNLFPQSPSWSLCRDLAKNQQFLKLLKDNPKIALIPYRSTEEFYQLVKSLRKKGLTFTTPETVAPQETFLNLYYNSKRGFRHLWPQALAGHQLKIKIPEGFIVGDQKEALAAGWWFRQHGKSFVIKHNWGTQGTGVKMIFLSQVPKNKTAFFNYLKTQLTDKFWQTTPLVVEEFIEQNEKILGGSPSVEFFISQEKTVQPTYACEQLLEKDRKTFKGCFIYPQLNQHPLIKIALKAGIFYGEALANLGYRGFFDMDLVIAKNGQVYAVETNLRRTGGTHVHETAQNLLGKNYLRSFFVLSEDINLPKNKKFTYPNLKSGLKDYLYSPKTKSGVIFANPDMLEVKILSLFYFAPNLGSLNKLRTIIPQKLQNYH